MDIPERMQLATSSLSQNSSLSLHTQLTEEDMSDAAMWVTQRLPDEKTKELEAVKKSTAKASRVLDQALKDIATKVSLEKEYTPQTRLSIYVLE